MPVRSQLDHTIALDDFWEASSLDEQRAQAFAARLLAYEDSGMAVHSFTPPGAPIALRPVRDRLQRLFDRRRSQREFDHRPLRHRDVERILAATGPVHDGRRRPRRVVPEAGGIDTIHVYAVVRNAEGPLAGKTVRYDHRAHTATILRPVPDDAELRNLFLFDIPTLPQMVIVFVVDLAGVVARYGPRGGRFALQQVGHAAQNVGLRLATDRRKGYVLGGGLDAAILHTLGLAHTEARYGGAVACGR